MDNEQSLQFFNRGPSPAVRLVFFIVLSILLLFVDTRFRYLEIARIVLGEIMAPIQLIVTFPGRLFNQAGDYFSTLNDVQKQNASLRAQYIQNASQLKQFLAIQLENNQLRSLLDLPQRAQFSAVAVELLYAERDVFKRRILVNKGNSANIQAGQVVMDSKGIVGQVTRVFPSMAEVTLLTEKNHAVPVQIVRNGLRTIAFGAGDTSQLALRYMPVSSDIKEGDELVTSGVDGLYPQGIPVAKVTQIERDAAYPFARITCLPLAGVDSSRDLLILTDLPTLPPRPEAAASAVPELEKTH